MPKIKNHAFWNECKQICLARMDYDRESGHIYWKPGTPWMKKIGTPLGCGDGRRGYLVIYVTAAGISRAVKAHRLAWLLHTGEWPDGEIDHINHDKIDNRINNLRCVPLQTNQMNRGIRKDNKSGYTGVHFCSRSNTWIGQFSYKCKKHSVGHYDSAEAAFEAVLAARSALGFHPNHGFKNDQNL